MTIVTYGHGPVALPGLCDHCFTIATARIGAATARDFVDGAVFTERIAGRPARHTGSGLVMVRRGCRGGARRRCAGAAARGVSPALAIAIVVRSPAADVLDGRGPLAFSAFCDRGFGVASARSARRSRASSPRRPFTGRIAGRPALDSPISGSAAVRLGRSCSRTGSASGARGGWSGASVIRASRRAGGAGRRTERVRAPPSRRERRRRDYLMSTTSRLRRWLVTLRFTRCSALSTAFWSRSRRSAISS